MGLSQDMYDIAVVGAGPAGATFARLAAAQYRVLVLDKKTDAPGSFHKPCGGLLSPDAQKALSRFDLTLPKEVLVDPQIFSVKTIDLATGLTRHYQRFYANLDRHKFDRWLQSLIPPQADCVTGQCTAVKRDGDGFRLSCRLADGAMREYRAKALIGADGAGSLVRRAFFPQKQIRRYVAIQQWFPETHRSPFYSCVFDPETSDCCSWSISKDHYFIFGGAFAPKGCRKSFERQKEKLKAFGFQFGEPLRTEACQVLRPSSPRAFCTGEGDVFLIGEAAGFISPSSLEGFSWAIQSGTMLTEALAPGFAGAAARYRRKTRALRVRLTGKMLKCPFMYRPALRRLVMESGVGSIRLYGEKK